MSNETFDENFTWYEWSFVAPADLTRSDDDTRRRETYDAFDVEGHAQPDRNVRWHERQT